MEQYSGLALIYDQLMAGIDYDDWARTMSRLVNAHGGIPSKTVLDLACGTGSTTLALARSGFQATGLDLSQEMLASARKKAEKEGLHNVHYLQADMRDFTVPGPVGLVVSFQDGINYLLTEEDFQQAVASTYRSLLPGGLFIFDINRVEKLQEAERRASEVSWADCPDFTLIWETKFIDQNIWEIGVTGFALQSDGHYLKFTETHRERIISGCEAVSVLQSCGFTLAATYDAFTLQEPDDTTRRVFYVARKES